MELLIVTLQRLTPDSLNLDNTIRQVLEDSRASFHRGIPKDGKPLDTNNLNNLNNISINSVQIGRGANVVGETVGATVATVLSHEIDVVGGPGPASIPHLNVAAISSAELATKALSSASTTTTTTTSTEASLAATLMYYWQIVMTLILLSFLTSCISQFAQHYKMTLDNEEISRLRAKLMKQQMYGGDDIPPDGCHEMTTPYVRTQIPFIKAPVSAAMPPEFTRHGMSSPASPYSLMLPESSMSASQYHHHSTPQLDRPPMDSPFCSVADTPERKRD